MSSTGRSFSISPCTLRRFCPHRDAVSVILPSDHGQDISSNEYFLFFLTLFLYQQLVTPGTLCAIVVFTGQKGCSWALDRTGICRRHASKWFSLWFGISKESSWRVILTGFEHLVINGTGWERLERDRTWHSSTGGSHRRGIDEHDCSSDAASPGTLAIIRWV